MERASQPKRGGYPRVKNEIRVNGKLDPDLPNDPIKIALILRERRLSKRDAKSVKAKAEAAMKARGIPV
ncbi:hypothetical protein [Rhizobium brockwellii]|uniref:Uncharacterized protein n=2 Tax=Rhizobium TaxID=379 RepID=A0A179C0K8_RHILE|nr:MULTISPECIES: hypothetical protein [Rhizobium]KPN22648.1 hypothetical protein KS05_32330 [Rhizobium brockwellii]OAP97702.1 hypothetical protein A4U53_36225 [Rhizobium leguminosarum]QJX04740.1 hypothetical protein RLCC275e_07165 [Rhizobium brockwellii]